MTLNKFEGTIKHCARSGCLLGKRDMLCPRKLMSPPCCGLKDKSRVGINVYYSRYYTVVNGV